MATISKPSPRRSVFAPRFSLQALLAALTAFAIGFPVWYRWPYTEEELIYREINGKPDKSKPPIMRVVTSWKRNWGGKPYKHGELRVYRADGGIIGSSEYRRDKRHGPKKSYRDDGSLQWIEDFADDVRIGMTTYRANGDINYRAEMAGNWLHGKLEQHLGDGTVVAWQFDNGRVIARNGERIGCGLSDALAAGKVEDGLARSLQLGAYSMWAASPQEDLALFTEETGIPIGVEDEDSLAWVEPLFVPYLGIDAISILMLKARALGRPCEYRDGQILIASPSQNRRNDPSPMTPLGQQ